MKTGIRLIPKPADTLLDPLNWSTKRKCFIFGTLAISSLVSDGAPASNYLAFPEQAGTYGLDPTQIAYGVSAAFAGYLIAPLTYPLLFQSFGKSAVTFWALVLQLGMQVWAALMTGGNDYAAFVASRFCCGALATIPFAAGSVVVTEMFFLHQRGRLFAVLELSFVFGVFIIPTLGGYILQDQSRDWPWTFWWTTPILALAATLVFIFMDETEFDRTSDNHGTLSRHVSWIQKRVDLHILPWKRQRLNSDQKFSASLTGPLRIMIAPNVLLAGCFNLVCFGFASFAGLFVPIFLQAPVEQGGYGFTPSQNASFSFVSWVAIAFGYLFLWATGDRIPLAVCRRRGGIWTPEYRLLNLVVPGILLPLGLGLFGITLKNHLHVLVLGLSLFLIQFSSQIGVPICINYAVENFLDHTVSVVAAMNILRLPLSIGLPFAATLFLQSLGPVWSYGLFALLCLGSFVFTLTVGLVFGKRMRESRYSKGLRSDEQGVQLFEPDSERGSEIVVKHND